MKKINKIIKLGFFILTITIVPAIFNVSSVHAAEPRKPVCLSNGDCSTGFTENGLDYNLDGTRNHDFDLPANMTCRQEGATKICSSPQTVQTQQNNYVAPKNQTVQQPQYHTPTQNYATPKPTYNNYVAPNTNNVSAEQAEQNTPVQNTENSTNNDEQAKKDAEEKTKQELANFKSEVTKKINSLPELNSTEKKNYISEVNKLDSKDKVNQILTNATNKNKSNLKVRLEKEKLAKQKKEEQERNNTIVLWSSIIGGVLVIGGITYYTIKHKKTNTK